MAYFEITEAVIINTVVEALPCCTRASFTAMIEVPCCRTKVCKFHHSAKVFTQFVAIA